jgi:hypothetical protein
LPQIRHETPSPNVPPWRTLAARRSSVPVVSDRLVPAVLAAGRVMTLMTPLTALAPHIVAPGPRITSTRSMSSSGTSTSSQ